ncbi:unnamed protein product [Heligmosomoides polygyrus]|uniref:Uncharacterized protein n=1 Tax=Heligmosomoides polygyrus TaxID=6339 RepID=A0A183GDY8_HELPZ|nr:unnamed protein product [Heligmosomoides polygyrus]
MEPVPSRRPAPLADSATNSARMATIDNSLMIYLKVNTGSVSARCSCRLHPLRGPTSGDVLHMLFMAFCCASSRIPHVAAEVVRADITSCSLHV